MVQDLACCIALSEVPPAADEQLSKTTVAQPRSPYLEMSDGTQLFYREAGEGQPVAVFVHGNRGDEPVVAIVRC